MEYAAFVFRVMELGSCRHWSNLEREVDYVGTQHGAWPTVKGCKPMSLLVLLKPTVIVSLYIAQKCELIYYLFICRMKHLETTNGPCWH